jgi:tyrosyl-DNA phosphodiesterase-1
MDVSSGEPSRKRRRSNDSQTNMRYLQRSLVASISPPPLQRTKLEETPKFISSPFQLTSIRDLPASSNVDAVSLKDLLCDPMISECWEFNYLHDIDFLMSAFDEDVREIVKVHVIHGFWKKEDTSRINLMVSLKFPLLPVQKLGNNANIVD